MAFHYHYYAVRYQEIDPTKSEELIPFVTRLVRTMNITDPLQRVYFDNSPEYKQRKDFYNLNVLKDYDYAATGTLPAERIQSDFLKTFAADIKNPD